MFPTQGLNPGLWHCRQILYQLSYQGWGDSINICGMNDVANLSLLAIPLLLCAFIWWGCGVGSCSRWRWDLGCGAGFFPEPTGSVVVVHGLSCSLAHGILVPRPGIEPASLALEGRFLTTGPPGESLLLCALLLTAHTCNFLLRPAL